MRFCFSGGGGVARLDAPTSTFLGVRNVATGARSNFLQGDPTQTGGVFGGSVTFGGGELFSFRPSAPPASVTIGGSYASFSQITFVGQADPGANTLEIFGTGVDPFGPGFIVPPGGGTFNDVFDHRYSRDVDQFNVFGQYNMPLLTTQSGATIAALARIGYTRTNVDESQSAELRNVPLRILNNADLSVDTLTAGAGFQVVAPVTNFFAFHAYGWGGAAFSDASGSDNFAFSGLLNGTQHNSLSDSHVGFAGAVGGGITVNLGNGFGGSATVSYLKSNSHPIVVRTGQAGERSRIEFEDADSLNVFFRTWMRFGN